mmetsp:Transcript_5906/g.25086  ORF Transcript_5906/g.25086 Transcript_5906/m.25086 type:complete len:379 (+) Transcript_5906:1355-2491(+)
MYASEEGHTVADAKALSSASETVPLLSASYFPIHARHKFCNVRSISAFSDSSRSIAAFLRRAVTSRFQRHVGWYPMYSLPSALAKPSTAENSSNSPSLASESVKIEFAALDVRDIETSASFSDALEVVRPAPRNPPNDEPIDENALMVRRDVFRLGDGVAFPFTFSRIGGLVVANPAASSLSVNSLTTSPAYVRGAKTPSASRSGNGSFSVPSPAPRVFTARFVPEPPRSSPTFRCPLGAREKSKPKNGPTGATPPRVISDAGTGPRPRLAVPGGLVDQSTRAWSACTTPRRHSGMSSQSRFGAKRAQQKRSVSWFASSASTSTSSARYTSFPSRPLGAPSGFEAYLRFHLSSGSRIVGNPHAVATTDKEHTYASVGS